VVHEERGGELLAELSCRVGIDAHAAFFQHDVALGPDDAFIEGQPGHPVGLVIHHRAQMLLRHTLEIGGVVEGGEGVLLAAEAGDDLGELARRPARGALEHQMLEEMRDAGLSRRIIGGAVAIPDHVSDDRRAPVGHNHDIHPIAEPEGFDRLGGLGLARMHVHLKPSP
jgi:hypothetical protein